MSVLRPLALAAGCLLACTAPIAAQVSDDFTDREIATNPTWTGTPEHWVVEDIEGGPALRSNGPEARDTLWLSTPSAAAFGRWTFRVAAPGVNWSSANGIRLYLLADTPMLTGPVRGYFLQLGTNNADRLALYRQDGPATASNRTRLGQSDPLAGTLDTLTTISVVRRPNGVWTVELAGREAFSAVDSTYTDARAFGIWVKHATTTGDAYLFDDVHVDPDADVHPPALLSYEVVDPRLLLLVFDEPIDPLTCRPDRFALDPDDGTPRSATCAPENEVRLRFSAPLRPDVAYTLTITGLSDRSGNALVQRLSFWRDPPDPAAPGDVVVNEFWPAPDIDGLEFVELYNRSAKRIDLARLTLADSRRRPVALSATGRLLLPDGYAVVAESAALNARFPGVDARVLPGWPSLNNGGDDLVLAYAGRTIDSVTYTSDWTATSASIERRDPAGPSDYAGNWAASPAADGATPGRKNAAFAPDTTAPRVLFVEQTTDSTLALTFDEPVRVDSGRVAIQLDGLTRPANVRVLSERLLRLDVGRIGEATRLRIGGLSDPTGNRMPETEMTIARAPRTGELILNEIHFDPLADPTDGLPDQTEYVELYNASAHLLTLNGTFWTDMPDERGGADTLRATSERVALAPHGYALVFPAGADSASAHAELLRAYPSLPAVSERLVLLPQRGRSLRLGNGGDVLRLHRLDGALLEHVAYDPGWHSPNLHTSRGTSLERLAVGEPAGPDRANDATLWTSSVDAEGGTPGRANATSARVPETALIPSLEVFPRPFSPDGDGIDDVLSIRYAFDFRDALVRAHLFDVRGRRVRLLEAGRFGGSRGQLLWDGFDDAGRPLPVGVYILLLEAVDGRDGRVERHKAALVLARGRRKR